LFFRLLLFQRRAPPRIQLECSTPELPVQRQNMIMDERRNRKIRAREMTAEINPENSVQRRVGHA
jgi:hypothetical protein